MEKIPALKYQPKGSRNLYSLFGILFILTGIFAILGGLYSWGEGIIFEQEELLTILIPWADIVLTGPLSILCGIYLLKHPYFGKILSLITSGIYLFGSVLVFISMLWNKHYPFSLILPAFSGIAIALGCITYEIKAERLRNQELIERQ